MPITVKTLDEAKALPIGTTFIGPDGESRTRSVGSSDIDSFLKGRGTPVKTADVDQFLKARAQAPSVNPAQMGVTSSSNYTGALQQQGYQPQAEQAGNAYLEGQRAGTNFNLDIAKSQFNKSQEEGQTTTQLQLPKDIQEKVVQYDNAFKAVDNVESKYSQALKSPFFGGYGRAAIGGAHFLGPMKDAIMNTDDRVKQYNTAAELAATPVANGVLNYTQGADSKASVIEKINDILPNESDAFNTGSGKLLQVRQMALNNLQSMRDDLSKSANYNMKPIDDMINKYQPVVQQNQDWYNKTFMQGNQPGVAPASTIDPAVAQMMNQRSGQAPPDPVSSFSPTRPQTPQTAQQQAFPTPSPTPAPNG